MTANPPHHHASRSTQEALGSIAKAPVSIANPPTSTEKASVRNLKASRSHQDLCNSHVLAYASASSLLLPPALILCNSSNSTATISPLSWSCTLPRSLLMARNRVWKYLS